MAAATSRAIASAKRSLDDAGLTGGGASFSAVKKKLANFLGERRDELAKELELVPGQETREFDQLLEILGVDDQQPPSSKTDDGNGPPVLLLTYPAGGYEPWRPPPRRDGDCPKLKCRLNKGGRLEQAGHGYFDEKRCLFNQENVNFSVLWKCDECGLLTRDFGESEE